MNKFTYAKVLVGFFLLITLNLSAAQIGVCNGMLGNNLPSSSEVVALYKQHNIPIMRLFDPNQPTLEALQGSGIQVVLGIPNSDIPNLAASQSNADTWVQNNVKRFGDVTFRYIAVGNEANDPQFTSFLFSAMQNINNAVSAAGLRIKVTAVIDTGVLGKSYPPSEGVFRPEAASYLNPIIEFLARNEAPLLVNVYPYFAYINNKADIQLDYALFKSGGVSAGGVLYQNLFYAIVDAVYAALEKSGGESVEVVVSESGWPSAGGDTTTVDNAGTYLANLIQRSKNGTPKRPGRPIETYLFGMFDENEKSPEYEKYFGIFTPNKQLKYPIKF